LDIGYCCRAGAFDADGVCVDAGVETEQCYFVLAGLRKKRSMLVALLVWSADCDDVGRPTIKSDAYLDGGWNLADDGDLLRRESDLFGGEIGDEDFRGGDFGHVDDFFVHFFPSSMNQYW